MFTLLDFRLDGKSQVQGCQISLCLIVSGQILLVWAEA
jgi:hypothetical protein